MGNHPGSVAEKLSMGSELIREALAAVSDSLLNDDALLDALGAFEQVGRWVDAGRVVTAAEAEKRSEKSLGEGRWRGSGAAAPAVT
jgi:hypothetical protein